MLLTSAVQTVAPGVGGGLFVCLIYPQFTPAAKAGEREREREKTHLAKQSNHKATSRTASTWDEVVNCFAYRKLLYYLRIQPIWSDRFASFFFPHEKSRIRVSFLPFCRLPVESFQHSIEIALLLLIKAGASAFQFPSLFTRLFVVPSALFDRGRPPTMPKVSEKLSIINPNPAARTRILFTTFFSLVRLLFPESQKSESFAGRIAVIISRDTVLAAGHVCYDLNYHQFCFLCVCMFVCVFVRFL